MRRRAAVYNIFFFFLFLFTHQAVSQEKTVLAGVNSALNGSLHGTTVFAGISGRMYTREKEREYAKLHIANQIAMYQKCIIDYGYVDLEGTVHDNQTSIDSNFDYDDNLINEILENIEPLAEYQFEDFFILIAKNNLSSEKNLYPPRLPTERPFWIRSVPNIEGYYTGVGIGDKAYTPYKSIFIADIAAAQTIAKENHLYIQTFTYDVLKEGIENEDTQRSGDLRLSKAELHGFHIIDRWIDADGNCYSLVLQFLPLKNARFADRRSRNCMSCVKPTKFFKQLTR
jgi:hypothetical protein